jgi:hypothetical protein
MLTKDAVISGWIEYYALKNPLAVTFVFNWNTANTYKANNKLREFHKVIDEERLGCRFYKRKPERRLDFLVAPEKFQAGHPHYHGLMSLPFDELERRGVPGAIQHYQAAWKAVVPSGGLHIEPVWDLEGWIAYSSKENCLAASDLAVWSVSDFVPPRA